MPHPNPVIQFLKAVERAQSHNIDTTPVALATADSPLPYFRGDYKYAGLISGYLMFQVWIGLILGPLSLLAAYALIRARHERFVRFVAWFNLIYVPTGTTVGTLLLIALRRGLMRSPPVP